MHILGAFTCGCKVIVFFLFVQIMFFYQYKQCSQLLQIILAGIFFIRICNIFYALVFAFAENILNLHFEILQMSVVRWRMLPPTGQRIKLISNGTISNYPDLQRERKH